MSWLLSLPRCIVVGLLQSAGQSSFEMLSSLLSLSPAHCQSKAMFACWWKISLVSSCWTLFLQCWSQICRLLTMWHLPWVTGWKVMPCASVSLWSGSFWPLNCYCCWSLHSALSLLFAYFQICDEQPVLWGQAVWGNNFCISDQREVAPGYKYKIDLTVIIATGISDKVGCALPEEVLHIKRLWASVKSRINWPSSFLAPNHEHCIHHESFQCIHWGHHTEAQHPLQDNWRHCPEGLARTVHFCWGYSQFAEHRQRTHAIMHQQCLWL